MSAPGPRINTAWESPRGRLNLKEKLDLLIEHIPGWSAAQARQALSENGGSVGKTLTKTVGELRLRTWTHLNAEWQRKSLPGLALGIGPDREVVAAPPAAGDQEAGSGRGRSGTDSGSLSNGVVEESAEPAAKRAKIDASLGASSSPALTLAERLTQQRMARARDDEGLIAPPDHDLHRSAGPAVQNPDILDDDNPPPISPSGNNAAVSDPKPKNEGPTLPCEVCAEDVAIEDFVEIGCSHRHQFCRSCVKLQVEGASQSKDTPMCLAHNVPQKHRGIISCCDHQLTEDEMQEALVGKQAVRNLALLKKIAAQKDEKELIAKQGSNVPWCPGGCGGVLQEKKLEKRQQVGRSVWSWCR